jgi:hypothetical protein
MGIDTGKKKKLSTLEQFEFDDVYVYMFACFLSYRWIYNVEITHNPPTIKSVKWAYPIVSLKTIIVSHESHKEEKDKVHFFSNSSLLKFCFSYMGLFGDAAFHKLTLCTLRKTKWRRG